MPRFHLPSGPVGTALFLTLSLMALVTLVAVGEARADERTIVVVAQNGGTEVTDFLVPYGVLSRAGVGEVRAVSTEAGPVYLWPGLTIEADESVDAFDARKPDGADLVIIPAVLDPEDQVLIGWLQQQSAKGAMLVSICDGALVLARTGLLDGRRATGHWYTRKTRQEDFPNVLWQENTRYVRDGNIATSAGVSASLPISLHLVDMLAGKARAEALAAELSLEGFSAEHNSEAFQLGAANVWVAARNFLFGWPRDKYALVLSDGMDEIALAFAVDMFARTYRSQAVPVGSEAVRSLTGLTVLPEQPELAGAAASVGFERGGDLQLAPGAEAPEQILAFLTEQYGRDSAAFVALQLEYPY
ncbi:MAG: hypothetical protein HEP70_11570 [Rhodobiaceae bacterium]|nr:hypothetical protein [Rhodobiaceae bacterium]